MPVVVVPVATPAPVSTPTPPAVESFHAGVYEGERAAADRSGAS
jgi:hypothetical protein